MSDFIKGQEDCKMGIYDKWYRYNHNGVEYDKGWMEQNKETQNEVVIFIECNKLF
jgi:hypothetical protein